MKDLLAKIFDWLRNHTQWAHFLGGLLSALLFGVGAAVVMAGTAELKDCHWGGRWDWGDFAMTCFGGLIGWFVHLWWMVGIFG